MPRIAPAALMVIIAALAFGMAGVLLTGSPPAAPGWPPFTPGPRVTWQDAAIVVVALVGLWLAYKVAQRLIEPTMNYPRAAVAAFLATAAAVLGLYVIFRIVGPLYGTPRTGQVPPPPCSNQNCTNPPPPPPPTHNPSLWNALGGSPWNLPWWTTYVFVAATVLAVALVALPLVSEWLLPADSESRSARTEARATARRALRSTLVGLEGHLGEDPRRSIVLLYGQLLDAVTRRARDTDPLTAREIERYCVGELGVRPSTAHALTLVFEEARYSTIPLGTAELERARGALTAALQDIARA